MYILITIAPLNEVLRVDFVHTSLLVFLQTDVVFPIKFAINLFSSSLLQEDPHASVVKPPLAGLRATPDFRSGFLRSFSHFLLSAHLPTRTMLFSAPI